MEGKQRFQAVNAGENSKNGPFYCGSIVKGAGCWYNGGEVRAMYELDKQKFGAFVAALRKEKGMTQRQLAERLYISDKAVSKWETGVSVPDTALLQPLAECLGVTATELLLCERRQPDEPLDSGTVEHVVQAAIQYGAGRPVRAYRRKSRWMLWYLLALVVGAAGMYANLRLDVWMEALWGPVLLGAGFGAYFVFGVRETLPPLYDQYKLNLVSDGIVRMHVPGLSFNNRNWPHIIAVGRLWACCITALLPMVSLGLWAIAPALWNRLALTVVLVLTLGGLFIPLYVVGKRYE